MQNIIYLDHAATTRADDAVINAMAACMRSAPYNASAAYSSAGEARRIHRLARRQIAQMLGCDAQEIIFTSGGTEANNIAVKSFAGQHVVLSGIEHHSVLHAAKAAGCRITRVMPDKTGFVPPDAVERALTPDTKFIALQAANNETGVIQPVSEVYALAQSRGVHLHVDAVQAFGHVPVFSICCDSMSLSAHKLYGPRGVGALFVRGNPPIVPLFHGGEQERGLRAGTENTPAICGFGVAAQMAGEDMNLRMARESALLDRCIGQLMQAKPGVRLLGDGRARLPGVAALLLPGITAEAAIAALDLRGILISGGAACASRSAEPSHVYTAMGLTAQEAAHVIRVSIGRHTTREELDAFAQALIGLIPAQARQSTDR